MAYCFAGELVGRCWNKSNGGVRSSKIKVDLLVERLLERVDPQEKIRQFGILLEDRQRFGGLGLAFAADARGVGIGVGNGLGGLAVGGGLDFLRLGLALVLQSG